MASGFVSGVASEMLVSPLGVVLVLTSTESLILAQDERWRRA
jgi:hypothetical protein